MTRPFRPMGMWLCVATSILGIQAIIGAVPGQQLDGAAGDVYSLLAFGAVALMWWGWWERACEWYRLGLLVASGAWAALALIVIEESWPRVVTLAATGQGVAAFGALASPMFAVCLSGMCMSSWWAERRGCEP